MNPRRRRVARQRRLARRYQGALFPFAELRRQFNRLKDIGDRTAQREFLRLLRGRRPPLEEQTEPSKGDRLWSALAMTTSCW